MLTCCRDAHKIATCLALLKRSNGTMQIVSLSSLTVRWVASLVELELPLVGFPVTRRLHTAAGTRRLAW